MVPYKGKYYLLRQYMPRKPTHWGVKVWCLVDARHKYVYDMQIYTGSEFRESLAGGGTGDTKTAHDVVLQLMIGLHGKSHVITTSCQFRCCWSFFREAHSVLGLFAVIDLGYPSVFRI